MTLSVDDVLRNTDSQDIEIQPIRSSLSDTSSNTAVEAVSVEAFSSEDIVNGPNSQNVPPGSQQTEEDWPLPPTGDARLVAEYNRILKQPGPGSLKRRRLAALNDNRRTLPVLGGPHTSIAVFTQPRETKNPAQTQSSSSTSSSSKTTSYIRSSEDINSIFASENVLQQSPILPLPLQSPASSFSSNNARLGSSGDSSAGSVAIQSAPNSQPLPPSIQPPQDGNAHSNGAAPRRIFKTRYQIQPQDSGHDRRNITGKNIGG